MQFVNFTICDSDRLGPKNIVFVPAGRISVRQPIESGSPTDRSTMIGQLTRSGWVIQAGASWSVFSGWFGPANAVGVAICSTASRFSLMSRFTGDKKLRRAAVRHVKPLA